MTHPKLKTNIAKGLLMNEFKIIEGRSARDQEFRRLTSCYPFALGAWKAGWTWPGRLLNPPVDGEKYDHSIDIKTLIEKDGLIPISDEEAMKKDTYAISLHENPGDNYHFICKPVGSEIWYHKFPGGILLDIDRAWKKITDPRKANFEDYELTFMCFYTLPENGIPYLSCPELG